jgi:GNAT superfamily N-acetyltransferase
MGCGRIGAVIEVRRVPGTDPDAQAMLKAMVDGLVQIYGPVVPGATPSAHPEELSPPAGGFVLLVEDGRAVAGGGFKRLDDGTCEIKRMYVVPEARSRGLARRLLAELETAARDAGYRAARLDTGREQPHARALYESAGYRAIPDYNDNAYAAYWGEKDL